MNNKQREKAVKKLGDNNSLCYSCNLLNKINYLQRHIIDYAQGIINYMPFFFFFLSFQRHIIGIINSMLSIFSKKGFQIKCI